MKKFLLFALVPLLSIACSSKPEEQPTEPPSDEYFEEEIKDSNGIICLYSNCSGAEMKKIDLAISFAINDMYDEEGNLIEIANHPEQIIKIKLDKKVYKNDIIRVKI